MKPIAKTAVQTLPIWLFIVTFAIFAYCKWVVVVYWDGVEIVDWVGALSGWIAAGAAGATIFVLLLQIKKNEEVAHRAQNEAKRIFDARARSVLLKVNIVWKHAEDILFQANKNDEYFREKSAVFKHRMTRIANELEANEFEKIVPLMHPIDAMASESLLKVLRTCTQPQIIGQHDQTKNDFSEVEAEGVFYFHVMILSFSEMFTTLKNYKPEFVSVFSNRHTELGNQVANAREKYSNEFFEREFPNNPKNPY
ncbi:MAG: hypothetical protein K5905_23055 [Roseibium sp.]|uniref:hypothetical protein n=1 Tax=Roseibium sp. TaxID=1936156 RepID=UPI00260B3F41|nr:hypothetical protein [Roseibium sp.]MCV0428346.1 hypothetical protein [Roseibium sp.]